jgi:hypothetical protein
MSLQSRTVGRFGFKLAGCALRVAMGDQPLLAGIVYPHVPGWRDWRLLCGGEPGPDRISRF